MREKVHLMSLIMVIVLICSGCGSSSKTSAVPKTTPKATVAVETEQTIETEQTVESIQETESAEPVVVETTTEAFDPVTEITDTMWVAYEYEYNNGYPMYVLNFRSDGTMEYMAGWVKSEIAFLGEGTWTSSGDQITYNITGDGYTFNGTLQFVLVAGDNLALSHVSGDALNYLMESGTVEFVIQGSPMDQPPI